MTEVPGSTNAIPAPLPTIPYNAPNAGDVVLTAHAMEMLRQTRPWARLIGILLFVGAGLMVVGGIAMVGINVASANYEPMMIVFGVLYVFLAIVYIAPGVYLNRYASRIAELRQYRREDLLERALEAQRSFWRFVGIAAVAIIILYILIIIGAIVFAVLS